MKWLEDIVDQFRNVDKEVLVSSGASPSGVYHVGHLREIVIADAVVRALKQAGIRARHVTFRITWTPFVKCRLICRPVTSSTWVCRSARCHHQMIGTVRGGIFA